MKHLCCFIAGKNSCDLGGFFCPKIGLCKISWLKDVVWKIVLEHFMQMENLFQMSWTEPKKSVSLERTPKLFLRTHNGKYKMWKQWKWKCERMPNIHKSGFLWFICDTCTYQPCTPTKVGVSWKIWFYVFQRSFYTIFQDLRMGSILK